MGSLPKILIIVSVLISQCAPIKKYDTQLKVVKGKDIPGGSSDPFPFVVPINDFTCSGSFIGPNVLITAAHCVANGKINYNGHEAVRVNYSRYFGDPRAKHGSPAHAAWQYKHDLAFGIFKEDVAPAIARLSRFAPQAGDDIAIVGYGCFSAKKHFANLRKLQLGQKLLEEDVTAEGAGIKRFGYNFIQSPQLLTFNSQGMLTIRTHNQPVVTSVVLGKDVGACPGDSGGPMLFNNEIVGVASYISPNDNGVYDTFDSYYASIHDQYNWETIQGVLEIGKVAGFKGSRPIWPRNIPPAKPKQEQELEQQLPQEITPPIADNALDLPPDNYVSIEDDSEAAHKLMQDAITLAMTRISNCAIVEAKLSREEDRQGTFEFQAQTVFLDGTLSPVASFTANYIVQNAQMLATAMLKQMFGEPADARIFQHNDPQKRAQFGCLHVVR